MSENIDDITMNYEEDGKLLVKELDKSILSKGAWTTIIFKFQELNNTTEEYGPVKFVIRRYQKTGGEYKMKSKFVISSIAQAQKIMDALQGWLSEEQDKTE